MAAQYPAAVKSFVTRNAGDVLQPSHVNDLQDEVNAIEAGLLQGSAPLNSSNSTLAGLSVTGKSTLAGNVQMNGDSSIVGNVTIGGSLTAGSFSFSTTVTANQQPRCKAVKTSTQTVANVTFTALTFNAEDFNVGSMHSTGTNPSRITIQSTGLYLFGAVVASTLNSQSGFMAFRKNGATFSGTRVKFTGNSSLGEYYHNTTIEQMTSTGDYMEVMVFHNTGGNLEFGTASSSRVDQPEFWSAKLW